MKGLFDMKRILLVAAGSICAVALIGWCAESRAQQPQEDPRVAAYRQLLLRANDELSQALAQSQTLQNEMTQLRVELAKLKKPPEPEKK